MGWSLPPDGRFHSLRLVERVDVCFSKSSAPVLSGTGNSRRALILGTGIVYLEWKGSATAGLPWG